MRMFHQQQIDQSIVRLAIGIHAMKQECKKLKLPDAELNRCVRLWCGILSTELGFDADEVIKGSTDALTRFTRVFTESKDFKLECAILKQQIIEHKMMPTVG